jgi:Zn-dependent protease
MFDVLSMDMIIYYIFLAIILLISIWLHEYAHARTSYKLGDPTPVLQWRLTPNPFKHVDVLWFLSIFLIWFWWWKPVQVNPMYYKNPVRDEALTAFAWPIMNLVLAFFWMLIMMIYWKIFWMWVQDFSIYSWDLVVLFWYLFVQLNISLAVFNMIPLPPLDGFRLIKILWRDVAKVMEKHSMRIILILFILIFSWSPIIRNYIEVVSDAIYRLLIMLFSLIFY